MAERNERVGRTYWLLHFRCTAWANGRSLFDRRSRRSGIWRFTLWWVCWRDWLLMWPSFLGILYCETNYFAFLFLAWSQKIRFIKLFFSRKAFVLIAFHLHIGEKGRPYFSSLERLLLQGDEPKDKQEEKENIKKKDVMITFHDVGMNRKWFCIKNNRSCLQVHLGAHLPTPPSWTLLSRFCNVERVGITNIRLEQCILIFSIFVVRIVAESLSQNP